MVVCYFLSDDLLEAICTACNYLMESASKFMMVRGKFIIAKSHIPSLWILKLRLFLEG
jgi:hypothetical protein